MTDDGSSFALGSELLAESRMKTRIVPNALVLSVAVSVLPGIWGCSAEESPPPGGGGSAGTTNSPTAGTGTSGQAAGGGASGSSSTAGAGGQPGAGGAQVVAGNGGMSSGIAGTGGMGGSGGSGGAGGSGAGGPARSGGCGKAAAVMGGRASIEVGAMMREYILALPDNYDQNKAYRLIFGWHPWGGSAQQVAGGGYYGLQNEAKGEAILVAPEGLDFGGNGRGWGNMNGQDLEFLGAMLERFRSGLCVDENRIFSTGFSFGGMMSFAAGCWPEGMMRAIAPMAGNIGVSGCEDGTRKVAVMGFHGDDDTVVAPSGGEAGRDVFIERNGCMAQSMPAQPSWCDGLAAQYEPCNCVAYQGCAAGYPVTWCSYNAGHMPAPSSGKTIWSFFSQF